MYDAYARKLIALIPDLPEIDRDACRRALSAAYFYVVRSNLSIQEDDFSRQDLTQVQSVLRGLGDALESVAVFDRLNGVERPAEEENASAFVAAEALFLLAALLDAEDSSIQDVLFTEKNYVTIEAALLYMIGGYDINAVSIVRNIERPSSDWPNVDEFRQARLNNATCVLNRIIALCCGDVRHSESISLVRLPRWRQRPTIYENLLEEIRSRFYEQLGDAIDAYLAWLGGYRSDGYEEASQTLKSIRDVLVENPEYNTILADVYHLVSLLLATIERTKERALIYNVPKPTEGDAEIIQDYVKYLQYRARGTQRHKGRPFLWPSVLEYLHCLPGPNMDAVIAMPTGSGKSFIAELAATHALCSGWVLYLAPTNALAHQIRRDLLFALRPFGQVDVRAFVGAEEYTTLSEEQISSDGQHFVAVMTPEKCALAIRLYPERFANCSLCVFDECHLINDDHRGVTADILIAQLCVMASRIRFLLMSAMLSNPEELAEWLSSAHGGQPVAPPLKWRPSRTLRGLLILDQESLETNYEQAKQDLAQLPARRKNVKFDVSMALVAGLSGPWTTVGNLDYRTMRLPISFEMRASRKRGESHTPQFDSWKNTAARLQSELLAHSGMPVLCFILSSRHHAFSSADKVSVEIPDTLGVNQDFEPLVEALLSISDAELGVDTILRDLLRRGIAVHTSAMLQPEQSASEWMFAQRKALLMFATPTLAQGLNLPAIGVVIAGTSMGDPRKMDKVDGVSRVNSLILNAFGRAGRPGFSNQGVAILASDSPFKAPIVPNLDPSPALEKYTVLSEEDATVEVISPIGTFLDHVLEGDMDVIGATSAELTLTSLLAEYDEEDCSASQILSRTLAAYHKRRELSHEAFECVANRIVELKHDFIEQPDVPDWINRAAMKAGVSFIRAGHIWRAYQQHGLVPVERAINFTVPEWFNIFFEVMASLPPAEVRQYFADEGIKGPNVLTQLRDKARGLENINTIPWEIPEDWYNLWMSLKRLVYMYMQGSTYADIAKDYLGWPDDKPFVNKRNSGSHPIPAVFGFLRKVVNPLAIDAGCFIAIHELGVNEEETALPDALQALPLCVRNGCNSLGVLSWYRFGYRERVCAHAFQTTFPLTDDLPDDSARAEWVRRKREQWLAGREQAEVQVLEYAKIVIQEGRVL